MISFRCCLWFDHQALEAVQFYKSLFPDLEIEHVEHYGKAGTEVHGQPAGRVMTVAFRIGKQKFLGLNGGPLFVSNPSFSNFIFSTSPSEVDRLWGSLIKGGNIRMPMAAYPWAKKYGWIKDQFGVEWQIMLSDEQNEIVPAFLFVDSLYGKGQEAVEFYTRQFSPSQVIFKALDEKAQIIQHVQFILNGQKFVLMEGAGEHGYAFNEAYSLIVECESQDEINQYWASLTREGAPGPCGWLKDRFGVSWQIAPAHLSTWLKSASAEQKDQMMEQMLKMTKIELSVLKQALGV